MFSSGVDSALRGCLFFGLFGVVSLGVTGWLLAGSPYLRDTYEVRPQPIPFSHKHHVKEVGLDCRYCHHGVAKRASAGMPSSGVCADCHAYLYTDQEIFEPLEASLAEDRSLPWTRVYELPDHVFFNHSAHVNNGVACTECHGQVENMALTYKAKPMTMSWCLDCHRDPAERLRPEEAVFESRWEPSKEHQEVGAFLMRQYDIDTTQLTDCAVCHR